MAHSHEDYFDKYNGASYEELLTRRDELIEQVHNFERNTELTNMDIDLAEPSADTLYQTDMLHLGEICRLITEKYRQSK